MAPHIKQEDIVFTPGGPRNFAGARVRIATWAVNWIARYPGERVQPYLGAGPGIFWGQMSGEELGTGSDSSLGLNAQAGTRIFLTENLASLTSSFQDCTGRSAGQKLDTSDMIA